MNNKLPHNHSYNIKNYPKFKDKNKKEWYDAIIK